MKITSLSSPRWALVPMKSKYQNIELLTQFQWGPQRIKCSQDLDLSLIALNFSQYWERRRLPRNLICYIELERRRRCFIGNRRFQAQASTILKGRKIWAKPSSSQRTGQFPNKMATPAQEHTKSNLSSALILAANDDDNYYYMSFWEVFSFIPMNTIQSIDQYSITWRSHSKTEPPN